MKPLNIFVMIFLYYILITMSNCQHSRHRHGLAEFVSRIKKSVKTGIVDSIGKCLINSTELSSEMKLEITLKLASQQDLSGVIQKLLLQKKEEVMSCFDLAKNAIEETDNSEDTQGFQIKQYAQCLQDNAFSEDFSKEDISKINQTVSDIGTISKLYLALKTHHFKRAQKLEQELLAKNNTLIQKCSVYHQNNSGDAAHDDKKKNN